MVDLVTSRFKIIGALVLTLALASCASAPADVPADAATKAAWQAQLAHWQGVPLLLLGEEHDASAHQQWERDTTAQLAASDRLAALVIEMAEAGHQTDGLPPEAGEDAVKAALHWQDTGWPWKRYGPMVMAAVRAGVPVRGGNLPRERMRGAMQDTQLDAHLSADRLAQQQAAVREGHCDLLPERQIAPMTRVQLARDEQLAKVALAAQQPGKTVLLVAGNGHVRPTLGIPTWLPANFEHKVAIAQAASASSAINIEADYLYRTAPLAPKDHCAALRRQWQAHPPQPAAGQR